MRFADEYLEESWVGPFRKPLMQERQAGGTALERAGERGTCTEPLQN